MSDGGRLLEFLDDPAEHSFIPWAERQHGPCFVCNVDEDEHRWGRLDELERRREERRARDRELR